MSAIGIDEVQGLLDAHLSGLMPEGVPVVFSGVFSEPPEVLWVRASCLPGAVSEGELGPGGYSRRDGFYYAEVISPGTEMPRAAWSLAALLEAGFRRAALSRLSLGDPYTRSLGLDQYNNFRLVVVTPWWCWTA